MGPPRVEGTAADWPAIVRQYGPLVWQTVFRLLGHQADAEDCFQETFVSALQMQRMRRDPVVNWAGLLQKVATARAIDRLRRRKWERMHRIGAEDPGRMTSPRPGPALQAQNTDLAEALRWALSQLPPQQSEAYCLRHLNELSYEEIARELGISTDHVGVLLHRSRARLRELLAGISRDETQRR